MIFKHIALFMILATSFAMGFPKLSAENIAIQTKLVEQINESPNNPELRFELAMEYASTGWIELGWDQLKLVPQLQENYAEIVFNEYSALVKDDPNNWKSHFRLAFAHYFLDRKDDAIESFKNVLSINKNHVWSMGLIGLIYGEKKDYKACISWSKKALKINDDATAIHFLLGQAYYETGNFFGVIGETLSVGRLKSIEAKYRPTPPVGITK